MSWSPWFVTSRIVPSRYARHPSRKGDPFGRGRPRHPLELVDPAHGKSAGQDLLVVAENIDARRRRCARTRCQDGEVVVAAKKTRAESIDSDPKVWHVKPAGPSGVMAVMITMPVT